MIHLATLFTGHGSLSINEQQDDSIPTYIAIISKKDGTTTTKRLNPTRRRSSSASIPSQPLKKRLVDSSFFLPKLRLQHTSQRRRSSAKSNIDHLEKDFAFYLPLEIIQGIVAYLDYTSILTLSSTSRYFYQLCQDDHIWYTLFTQDFHTPRTRYPVSVTTPQQQRHHMALYRNHCILARRWLDGQVDTRYLQGHEDSIYCMARLGRHHLVSGSRDRTIKIWHFQQHKANPIVITKRAAHEGSVLCLSLSHNGKTMLSGSSDATCILWCLQTLRPLQVLRGHTHGVLDVCLMDDDYYVSASRDHTLCVWDTSKGTLVHRLLGHLGPVNALDCYDKDHVISASGDGTLKVWQVRSGQCIKTFTQDHVTEDPQRHGLACVKSDGQQGLVYSGGQDGKIRVWDYASGTCVATLSGHHGLIRTMDIMEGGKILVTGSYDKTIRVWDLKKRQCILSFQSGHSGWIFNLLVSRSRIFSAGQDKQIMMLDFGKGLSILDD
ncbi:WD40-repeat-containing domain protein [Halteromyces radiatus]|uniref:WD40-repeat-containing domain protein n=1 Tax=Halteromyces radiatus TaxID=101107 RepID=UPI00221E411C|nr:WD40-repeat-containing domain protein [Halteromyces radiatus]KAI8079747.1 WD40-repeat-containing domain protein [Halteromyces radiatus]